ncbi:hypothetical protein CRN84_24515 [Budvicia aquatica]|uniref:Uncharacterized protein n=1 Tax=Budvicia aquatica TaxID=82979 RepID=A0A2C6DLY0_9GAMM|nr:hypothetical protein CRN84_24515 [Budvicia aquatica]
MINLAWDGITLSNSNLLLLKVKNSWIDARKKPRKAHEAKAFYAKLAIQTISEISSNYLKLIANKK